MIDVREAVKVAQDYLKELYPYEAEDIRLEEVELINSGGRSEWQVTLSFFRRADAVGTLGQLVAKRNYKTFTIDAGSKQVRSMKIRQV